MRLKKLTSQALASLLLISALMLTSVAPANAEYNSTSNRNWMEQVNNVNPNFANTSIRDVILPGTHDSGTGVFNASGFDSAVAPDIINPREWAQYAVQIAPLKNKSRSQDYKVSDQLNLGVRYLDLRVGPNFWFSGLNFHQQDNALRTMHGLYGEYVEDILQATKVFLNANSKEIVVLDFQHFHEMNTNSYTYLRDRIQFHLGNMLVPNTYGVNTTLGQLWNENKRVIVLYGDHNYWSSATTHETGKDIPSPFMNETWVWNRKNFLHSQWVNESNSQAMKQSLQSEVNTAGNYPNMLHVLQNVVTPTTVSTTTISDVAGSANTVAMDGLQSNWTNQRINIIMTDFFNNCDIVNVIKRLNMKYKDPDGTNQGVYVYEHPDYNGRMNRILGEADNLTDYTIGNDTLSSVKIVGPYKVELYENSNFQGTKSILTASSSNIISLPVGDNRVTSLRVQRLDDEPGVYVYQDSNYEGKSVHFTQNESNMGLTSVGHDAVSSIKIVGPYRAEVFEHADYQGNMTAYTSDASSIGGWNDKISSIKVYKLP
ncbi:hypothetical protein GCM10008018_11270 [Paenibacillus marchantiophytorum]|uniref:Beta/gamma crystallin 'Greek key' domain-containing protein n=1 Tax=Paenibacillus marchantiophytorum TaxID=1619310 RepID=A0ABQ2BUG1_9BACL|nr:beta/gamma crystallin-related protein [Paenibacillus marchantiophytorum]GGI45276.1 hypothetical protein GCM10008018_11270 [Paenibacillus marchantiophytorum]